MIWIHDPEWAVLIWNLPKFRGQLGGSGSERGVVPPDFHKEALSVSEGLSEGSLGLTELGLQCLTLQREDYGIA